MSHIITYTFHIILSYHLPTEHINIDETNARMQVFFVSEIPPEIMHIFHPFVSEAPGWSLTSEPRA